MRFLNLKHFILLLMLLGIGLGAVAQETLSFSVAEFQEDPLDLSAKDKRYEKFDGNGERFAIIKVTSTSPQDKLSEYTFNFGNMRHISEMHDGALWVYVQRNAKQATIARSGYNTLRKYDLGTTIQSGKNYSMVLDPKVQEVQSQIVQFNVTPADALATIAVQSTAPGATEEILGTTRTSGTLAKSIPCGAYKYKVISANYLTVEGKFILSNPNEIHIERITMEPNFGQVTLIAPEEADIFINGERKGRGTWRGTLSAGTYNVECQRLHHRPSRQTITVSNQDAQSIVLPNPTPITKKVFVSSEPLGADIYVDGTLHGQTPQNIDLLIGKHQLLISKKGVGSHQQEIELSEYFAPEVDVNLTDPNFHNVATGKASKKYQKKSCFYIGAGPVQYHSAVNREIFAAAASLSLGADIHDVNLECAYMLATNDEFHGDCSYPNCGSHYTCDDEIRFTLGYSFIPHSRIKLTPQIGWELCSEFDRNSGVAGIKGHFAITKHMGVAYSFSMTDICQFNTLQFVYTF